MTLTQVIDTVDIQEAPPEIQESEDFDGGDTPEYSTFVLVGLSKNPLYDNEKARIKIRDDLFEQDDFEYKDELSLVYREKHLGLIYDDYDAYNPILLWAKTSQQIKDGVLLEDAAIYAVNDQDRMWSNTYKITGIIKIDQGYFTCLNQQAFEDIEFEKRDDLWAESTVRTLRGYWGHKQSGDIIFNTQVYTGDRPLMTTVQLPFRKLLLPPNHLYDDRDEETLRKASMYDPKMLRMAYGLTANLIDTMGKANPANIQRGKDLRYLVHCHLFPGTDPASFSDITPAQIPERLKDYKHLQLE